jgi:hypothetical protein
MWYNASVLQYTHVASVYASEGDWSLVVAQSMLFLFDQGVLRLVLRRAMKLLLLLLLLL